MRCLIVATNKELKMTQQINLALSTLPTGHTFSQGRLFVIAFISLFIVMSGIYLLELRDSWELEQNLKKKRQEHAVQVAKIDDIALSTGLSAEELAILIQQRETMVRERRNLITELVGGPNLAAPGFSHFLDGLANFPISEVWITAFTVGAENGSAIELVGQATRAEEVAKFVRGLSTQEIFLGMEVATLEIKEQNKSTRVNFRLLLTEGRLAKEIN